MLNSSQMPLMACMWIPCEPTEQGAVQITMPELDAQGLASKVWIRKDFGHSMVFIGYYIQFKSRNYSKN
jgi:hypothetical protein